jgi:hypothetical protein
MLLSNGKQLTIGTELTNYDWSLEVELSDHKIPLQVEYDSESRLIDCNQDYSVGTEHKVTYLVRCLEWQDLGVIIF